MLNLRFALVLASLLLCLSPRAADVYVPPDLAPWQEWVLHDHQTVVCPLDGVGSERASCLWPGQLNVEVDDARATFEQRIENRIEAPVALPHAHNLVPQNVRADGRPVAVVLVEGRPRARLPVGTFVLTGEIRWDKRPAAISLPPGTGRVALTLDGTRVARPRWDGESLLLGQPAETEAPTAQNRIDLAVYRTLRDGAPPTMQVTLRLDVAGSRREVTLGKVLPAGFEPTSLSSPLPARLDASGQLEVQVAPGQWTVRLGARTTPPLGAVTFERDGELWPQQEIWSYADEPSLRVTEPRGATPVDPAQVGVAPQDAQLPAFVLNAGDSLSIEERQRGYSPDARNELTLARELWLGFDRASYVARDRLNGRLRRDWRLDLAAPLVLESASLDETNLLVTAAQDTSLRGVELRDANVRLTAVSRTDVVGAPLPVSGWQTTVNGVQTSLYLPPGQRLLATFNVDRSSGDWASAWTLLDFFLVLIVAAALWRTCHPLLGALGLAALVLTIHEPAAPKWSWLFLVAALGALRVMPVGKLRGAVRVVAIGAVAIFGVISVPFVAQQVKWSLYPQLESQHRFALGAQRMAFENDGIEEVVVTANQADARTRAEAPVAQTFENARYAKSRSFSSPRSLMRYAKDVQVQAGPGLPGWQSRAHRLNWVGPIDPDQTFRLVILPRWAVALWRVLGVALLIGVAAALLRRQVRQLKPPSATGTSAAALALLGASLISTPAPTAQAQSTPAPEVLQDLQRRLLAPPECAPVCTSIERARVTYDANTLNIELVAHAQADVALWLPGDPAAWHATSITVDGRDNDQLGLFDGGFRLPVSAGVHRIVMTGPLPNASSVSVAFPLRPGDVTVQGRGWEVSGLVNRRLQGGALTLARIEEQTTNESTFDAMDAERFPAFVRIERRLQFGLDWTVTTQIHRVTPPTAAINIQVPLLPDEAVNDSNISVLNGIASVTLAPGRNLVAWTSTLTRTSPVTLTAAVDAPWQETWWISADANWRLDHRGVPRDNREIETDWNLSFTPWPGESLTLDVSRPAPVEGPTIALDLASLNKVVGRRGSESTLTLNYRATQGGQHRLVLPAGATLTSLTQDNQVIARGLDDNTLVVPVLPGTHQLQVLWRGDGGSAAVIGGDAVDLGLPAANVSTSLRIPDDRWVLWASGPQTGPAVLYWSELLVLVLVAVALGRFTRTPLKTHHWLLLGLGFSTFFWPALAVLIVTLLAYRWRETTVLESPTAFNATQVGLIIAFGMSALALLTTIPFGLLGSPNMHITGNRSGSSILRWFSDRVDGTMPDVSVLSLPLWVYKALILIWALWIALAVLRWLPWMWRAFNNGGYWKKNASAANRPTSDGPTPDQSASAPAKVTDPSTTQSEGSE